MSNIGTGDQEDRIKLRFQFVELLFALATAEVAVRIGDLAAAGIRVWEAPAAYSHLGLALIMIATSWIGWKASTAAGNRLPLENVFTLAFLVLLLDVALVVFYFIIVRRFEGPTKSLEGSAGPETFWVFAIFVVYVLWDFVTKVMAGDPKRPLPFWQRLSSSSGPFWVRGGISMQCCVVALVVWCVLKGASTWPGVVATDAGLVTLDLFYRSRKQDPAAPGRLRAAWSLRSKTLASLGVLVLVAAFYWH
jgi:hypothetical protein